MENKINIAKLLKDCPSGMELDCTTWESVTLERVTNNAIFIKRNSKVPAFDNRVILNQYGRVTNHPDEKCRIFPKGKTTWEGFCKPFKNGDIVATATGNWIGITEGGEKDHSIPTHCVIKSDGTFEAYFGKKKSWAFSRLATDEEKQKLFTVIKRAGYCWNDETKALERLIEPIFKKGDKVQPKNMASRYRIIDSVEDTFYTLVPTGRIYFTDQNNWELAIKPIFKVGDKITYILGEYMKASGTQGVISEITDDKYIFTDGSHLSIANQDYWKLVIEPIFKVGNKIKDIRNNSEGTILKITTEGYECHFEFGNFIVSFKDQNNWKLVPKFKKGDNVKHKESGIYCTIGDYAEGLKGYHTNIGHCISDNDVDNWELVSDKFDINTLVPFESKVLIRNAENQRWIPAFWGCRCKDGYITTFGWCKYCIPFEYNSDLMNSTLDCSNYFKTWE